MTPAEQEAEFIRLWQAGLETAAIAAHLGLKATTAQSRARRLQQQGKIPPRPRGGNYPTVRAKARSEDPPAPPAPQATPAPPATPAITMVAVPEMQELLSLVKDLHARVVTLEETRVPPALPAPPATPTAPATPASPAAERKDVQQWTVRLSKALIEHLKAVAYERRVPPSQLLEELAWKALNDRP